jgi:hypothetical protein
VAVAALFYGQARASPEDVAKLHQLLGLSAESNVASQMTGFPDRGRAGPMPPVEPLIYRLYEIVQNYGYAFKAVMNEKFGDGIMSAICFNSKVEKEVVSLSLFVFGYWVGGSRYRTRTGTARGVCREQHGHAAAACIISVKNSG